MGERLNDRHVVLNLGQGIDHPVMGWLGDPRVDHPIGQLDGMGKVAHDSSFCGPGQARRHPALESAKVRANESLGSVDVLEQKEVASLHPHHFGSQNLGLFDEPGRRQVGECASQHRGRR